jgi:hypothetical protein
MTLKKILILTSIFTVIASWLKIDIDIVRMVDSVNSLLRRNRYDFGEGIIRAL